MLVVMIAAAVRSFLSAGRMWCQRYLCFRAEQRVHVIAHRSS
ncbi:conserved hypothetical protein [Xylella fastidiosa M12]|nr:conserved hypothetical protein [Xylella fastidiosa M12]